MFFGTQCRMQTADIAKSTQCWCERIWAADLARSAHAPLTCSATDTLTPAYMDCWWDWSRLRFNFSIQVECSLLDAWIACERVDFISSTGFRGSVSFRGCLRWI